MHVANQRDPETEDDKWPSDNGDDGDDEHNEMGPRCE